MGGALAAALEQACQGRPIEALACLTAQAELLLTSDVACTVAGLLYAGLGDDPEALTYFDRALALGGTSPAVLANRAATLQRLGKLDAALEAYDEALAAGRPDPEVLHNHATALHLAGRLEQALGAYDAALRLRPRYPQALAGRGIALQELGRSEEALLSYDIAVGLAPDDATTFYNRGNVLRALGRPLEALASYRRAIGLEDRYVEALCACALACHGLERHAEALACCDQALRADPRSFEALFSRGSALHELGRFRAAAAAYDAALEVKPDDVNSYCNRAVTLLELDEAAAALASCEAALKLRPDMPEALCNRGNVLLRLLRFEEAAASYDAALRLRPDYVEALGNRGVALKELGLFEAALASFDAALALDPAFAHALNNKGALLLLLGRFAAGWEAYESRWMAENLPANALPRTWPEWSGQEPLEGKRILVLDEQGLGDVIQFSRYLLRLAGLGGEVTFLCRRPLHRLIGSLAQRIRLIAAPAEGESFDYEIPLVSLPRAFHAGLGAIEARVPYLSAKPELIERWAARIGKAGFRVGICWQGNPNPKADVARAVPLEMFAALAAIPGVRLISLQRHFGVEPSGNASTSFAVETLGEDFDAGADAFVDAAAVIADLDLVVTCDTSIAHLAGALGRPVWVALKSVPDWRYLLEREESPWYPTMRLFRQVERGDWAGVFDRIAAALRAETATRQGKPRAPILIPGGSGELIDKIVEEKSYFEAAP